MRNDSFFVCEYNSVHFQYLCILLCRMKQLAKKVNSRMCRHLNNS